MSFKQWAKQQKDAEKLGTMLINTFCNCTKDELSDVEFMLDQLLEKYGEDEVKWLYSIDELTKQRGWDTYRRVCR